MAQALAILTPEQVAQRQAEEDRQKVERERAVTDNLSQRTEGDLAAHVRTQFEMMRNHRSSAAGWNDRLLEAQRAFIGEYDPVKLAKIKEFGGSEIYARIISAKSRGAYAMLRDVYLGQERPWGIEPTPEPTLPDDIYADIRELVSVELQQAQQQGVQINQRMVQDRINGLLDGAARASRKKAKEEAAKAERRIDDILSEGGFYKALSEVLFDIPMFPYVVMKGPTVRIVPSLTWVDGRATMQQKPRLFWNRISPFDIYWTPGVNDIQDANIIEKLRLTRASLNDLLDLPGYNHDNVKAVLTEYADGYTEYDDPTDNERAQNESRENPLWNRSGLIDCLEFHGNIQGKMLRQYGMSAKDVPDETRDYFVQIWQIGRYVIKAQLHPSPRKRHPYYISSFEKVPGTPVGNCLTDILSDVQDVCNSTLRALVNNMAMSSGPMVSVNTDRLHGGVDPRVMHPWKIWLVVDDPMSQNTAQKPIEFFQPGSNANELLGVYEKFTQMADELSAIPRYVTGSDRIGGAARTSSGLAMLMGNAGKVLQTVASNIDRDIVEPLLQSLYDMIMLTDTTGILRGDEKIVVRGVNVVVQRETNRQRQLEFLQATANPIDMDIIGKQGRASVLRGVSSNLGLGDDVVPSEEDIASQMRQQQAEQMAMMQAGAAGPGQPPGNGPGPNGGPPQAKPSSGAPGVEDANAMRGMA